MIQISGSMEEILNCHISGFHQYVLEEPVHLAFVSQSLCDMTGYTGKELSDEKTDGFARLVHPADRKRYSGFLRKLAQKEQTVTVQYRIVRKDGAVMYVSDTASSKRLESGALVACCVLTDITSVKEENENLRFLNETIPCGFLKYTCEKQPRVTYINEQMLQMLRFPERRDGELDYQEFYKENIYLMIPIEERRRFAHFLNRVSAGSAPIAGEVTVLRCDGTKARLYGWIIKAVNEQGQEEFQSVCMDITERYQTKKASETQRYLKALSEVYNKIFEYDFSRQTVKYVYGENADVFGRMQNVPMHLKEATEQWIENAVLEADRAQVRRFFEGLFAKKLQWGDSKPPQIRFRSLTAGGEAKEAVGIVLKIDDATCLFCCRNVLDQQQADSLRSENLSLKSLNENIQELVMRFTDGMAAFEVHNGRVKPLYASDNVCHFFGYTKEAWMSMMQESRSIKEFVSQSGVAYEDFAKLLETGEASFTYVDVKTKAPQRIKAICSQKTDDGGSPRYVMLYKVDDSMARESQSPADTARIYIRTFGYFDVFVDGTPIAFRNKKSKELFALLADRQGGYVSSEEAIGFLWPEEEANTVTLARYRKVALRLKNILEEYGIADVVESVDGKRRIVTDKVRCDLYDYLSQKEEFAQLFHGSYLTNYSWGETTLGGLLRE